MKNKGFTLLELTVVVGIMSVLFFIGGVSYCNFCEKRDYSLATERLYDAFRTFADNAGNSETRINLNFDLNNNLISFEKGGKIISKFQLPKRYTYSKTGSNIHFTETGNVSPMFSFEVKEDNKSFFKLSFISTDKFVQKVRIIKKRYIGNNWVVIE